jgi:hypothetical protein
MQINATITGLQYKVFLESKVINVNTLIFIKKVQKLKF